jgi:hypothetical protein
MTTTNKINLRTSVIALMILLAAFSRIIPHMPNFSPLAAIGLFGAAYLQQKWQVFLIPLAAAWLSDLFINNIIYGAYYPEFTWFYGGFYWQYGSYVLIMGIALLLFKEVNMKSIVGGSLMATVVFFLVTNFGVWLGSPSYPQNMAGLMQCYAMGVPFLKGTMLGDLFYVSTLFGAFALLQRRYTSLRLA